MKILKIYPFITTNNKLNDVVRIPNVDGNFKIVNFHACDTCALVLKQESCLLKIPCPYNC